MTLLTKGVTKDTFPINFKTVYIGLSTTSDPDKSNLCLADHRAGGRIIFGSAWRNIAAMAAVSHT